MVSERVKRLFEDKLTIKDTKREGYWSRIIANVSFGEMGMMEKDIGLIKKELAAAKEERDTKAEKELEQLLKEKEMDLRLLRAIIVEARRLIADENVELRVEKRVKKAA